MDEKICIILPYEELYEIAKECKNERNLKIQVKKGNLEEAVPLAVQSQNNGAEILISRGGTATLIKNHVSIPVVEIKVNYLDILRVLYPFKDSDSTLLIIGYENVVNGCKSVSKILNINIEEIIVPSNEETYIWKEIIKKINILKEKYKVETIIGDAVSINMVGPLFKEVRLITSGKESVYLALEEAFGILNAKNIEKEKAKRIQAILDFVNDGVVAIDENGIITAFNPSAEKIFEIKSEEAIGNNIDIVIKENNISKILKTENAELEQIYNTSNTSIISNQIPIKVEGLVKGVVSTFQETSIIQGVEEKIRKNLYSRGLVTRYSFNDIITKNKNMKKTIEIAKNYSKTDATILIQGESGTGKEIFAQSIHTNSTRTEGPFVAINCAALPPQLLESELFGYAEGSFTGAAKGGKVGLFEMAHNGTIFLDEVGDMDKILQARLLRVLEEKQVMRIGSDKIVPINIRVIAATNVNLKEQVTNGKFRSDLYYRLNVLNLNLAPLRDRIIDIEYLANHFIKMSNKKYGTQVEKLSPEVIEILSNYSWPGNIREMKNIIERIVLISKKDYITLSDIEIIIEELNDNKEVSKEDDLQEEIFNGTLKDMKKKIINKVLKEEGYNKSKTAKRLGIDRSTLERFI